MKKLLLLGVVCGAVGLTSCLSGEQKQTMTFATDAVNIVTSVEDETTSVSLCLYTVNLDIVSGTGTIVSGPMVLNNNSLTLSTKVGPYITTGQDVLFKNIEGSMTGNVSLPLMNSNFLAVPYYGLGYGKGYNYDLTNIGEKYTYVVEYSGFDYKRFMISDYNIDNKYIVKTFQRNTFFKGTTTTNYEDNNGEHNFSTEDIVYRICLNFDENNQGGTATLIIYNAKFSDSPYEPVKTAIIAEDLDVEYSADGIVITGENIPSQMPEGNALQEVPTFPFNSIRFETTSDDLTQCKISYKVAGKYNGEFTGSYVSSPSSN